jgi:hypothetical protein
VHAGDHGVPVCLARLTYAHMHAGARHDVRPVAVHGCHTGRADEGFRSDAEAGALQRATGLFWQKNVCGFPSGKLFAAFRVNTPLNMLPRHLTMCKR